MVIRFAKGKQGKPVTLTCVRDDGSVTWQPSSPYFAYHDLIHYAVETTLGYREAFLGLVAKGRELDAFGTRDGVKDTYTQEEAWAESIVGLLQWPAVSGGAGINDAEFFEMLAKTCTDNNRPIPPLTPEQLARIRTRMRALHQQWADVPEGETFALTF